MFNPDLLIDITKQTMPFGKYKDTIICDLPTFYLEWFHTKGFPKGKLGDMLATVYEIKINGLEEIIINLKYNEGLK